MSWTYSQHSGEMVSPDGTLLAIGYSGNGVWKNDPSSENVKDHGPLPQGKYTIGVLIEQNEKLGPYVLPLIPDSANEMYGRGGFYIHGDDIAHPGDGSDGCIVLHRDSRIAIAGSSDKVLEVTA